VRRAGSVFLHGSAEFRRKYTAIGDVIAWQQGYDGRLKRALLAAGLLPHQISVDGSTHPLFDVVEEMAEHFGLAFSPQVDPIESSNGLSFKPDAVVEVTEETEKAVRTFLRCIGAGPALVQQIVVVEKKLVLDAKCCCAFVTSPEQQQRMENVDGWLRDDHGQTLFVFVMTDTALVPCIRGDPTDPFTWKVLGRCVFQAPGQSAAAAILHANDKVLSQSQRDALAAYRLDKGKHLFSEHPAKGDNFTLGEAVPAHSKMMCGGQELKDLTSPDSFLRRGTKPLRTEEIAEILLPLLAFLPAAEQAELRQRPEYVAAAAKHATGRVSEQATAVAAEVAAKPRPGLRSRP
jgi:hypothetical protein